MPRPARRANPAPPVFYAALTLLWVLLSPGDRSRSDCGAAPSPGGSGGRRGGRAAGRPRGRARTSSRSPCTRTTSGSRRSSVDALERIVLVKNAEGDVYAPAYGVHDLDTWRWDRGPPRVRSRAALVRGPGAPDRARVGACPGRGLGVGPVFRRGADGGRGGVRLARRRPHPRRGRRGPGRTRTTGPPRPSRRSGPGEGYRIHLAEASTLVYGAPAEKAAGATRPAPAPPPRPVSRSRRSPTPSRSAASRRGRSSRSEATTPPATVGAGSSR